MSYIFNVAGVAMRGEQKDVELMDMRPALCRKKMNLFRLRLTPIALPKV